jgi:hypothetical protein
MELLSVEDLSALECTYLGVLSVGLVPFELAKQSRFRMEYVCAVCHARMQALPHEAFLDGEHSAKAGFLDELRRALMGLDQKGIVGVGPPQDVVLLTPSPELVARSFMSIDINKHPPIFDRYLAQRCMDLLFAQPTVHEFLLGLYADSSDIWGELYNQGYGQYR